MVFLGVGFFFNIVGEVDRGIRRVFVGIFTFSLFFTVLGFIR